MFPTLAKMLGGFLLRRAVQNGAKNGAPMLDIKLGGRLLRDGRVPVRFKVQSLGIGLMALLALEFFELPLQAAMMFLLPFVGLAADLMMDGVEVVAVPLLVASVVLPHLLPRGFLESLEGQDSAGRVYNVAPNS